MSKPNPQAAHHVTDRTAAATTPIQVELDQHGHVLKPEDWTEALAIQLAAGDNIELTEAHWQLIRFVRDYHADYGIAPGMRLLVAAVRKRLSPELASSRYLYNLFPDSPARQLSCYAGLPKPVSCI